MHLPKKSAVGSDGETVIGVLIPVFDDYVGAAVEITPASAERENGSLVVGSGGLNDSCLCGGERHIVAIPSGQIGVYIWRSGNTVFLDAREHNNVTGAFGYDGYFGG